MEGSGDGIFQGTAKHLPGGTEENYEKLSQDSRLSDLVWQ